MSFLAQFRPAATGSPTNGAAPAGFSWHEFASTGDYGRTALEREAAIVRGTQPGARNHALNRAAFSIGQLVADGRVSKSEAYATLYAAGIAAGLAELEVRRTLASGFSGGASKPRPPQTPGLYVPGNAPAVNMSPDMSTPERPALSFLSIKELRARVASAGPRQYLLRGYWPHGDYGVHAGDMKAQKTWTTIDAVVSVASGTEWLGLIPVDQPGPVLMFAGEGGEGDLLRRIDAVATGRGLAADDLPIVVCCRAPHLSDSVHLGLMADQLDLVRPILTTLDPLYLAARGAKLGDLYAMGAMLEAPQHLCQEVGSSLWVAHHQNRKEGRGAMRMSGAGPAEWGRVLISATVVSRNTDPMTAETTVVTELDTIGGSIAGGTLRVVRRIRAENPHDLDSPLHYAVTTTEGESLDNEDDMPPARAKLLEALRALGAERTGPELGDWVKRKHGHGLSRQTISTELGKLAEAELIDRIDPTLPGKPAFWTLTEKGQR